ncbi:hypothetical protein [uncultured Psychroserpens sp.]|nr:hypothetical protein [uncultured Psychroserpens sp.]
MDTNLAKITTILSIALVTILGLLVLNLVKVYALKKENKALRKQINKE